MCLETDVNVAARCLSDKVLLVLYLLVSFRNAFVMTQRLRCPGRLILVNRLTSYDSDCQQSPIRTQVIRRDLLVSNAVWFET
jgi:hypothetical protein